MLIDAHHVQEAVALSWVVVPPCQTSATCCWLVKCTCSTKQTTCLKELPTLVINWGPLDKLKVKGSSIGASMRQVGAQSQASKVRNEARSKPQSQLKAWTKTELGTVAGHVYLDPQTTHTKWNSPSLGQ